MKYILMTGTAPILFLQEDNLRTEDPERALSWSTVTDMLNYLQVRARSFGPIRPTGIMPVLIQWDDIEPILRLENTFRFGGRKFALTRIP